MTFSNKFNLKKYHPSVKSKSRFDFEISIIKADFSVKKEID